MSDTARLFTQDQLDRLVDGELSESERRGLIARFDELPDGWRRCALAFLEAQAWRTAMGPLAADAGGEAPVKKLGVSEKAKLSDRRRWLRLAVSVLLAFGLGLGAGRFRAEPAAIETVENNKLDNQSRAVPARTGAARPGSVSDEPQPDEPAAGYHIEGVMQIEGDEPGLTLPVLAGPGLDEDWLRSRPDPLPAAATRRLEEHGWQVEQERRILTVVLADGQRLLIPIDSVRYQFVPPTVY
ncbi:MAG: hypothetical protein ACREJB_06120 [Planctomycetaceae bacterium]